MTDWRLETWFASCCEFDQYSIGLILASMYTSLISLHTLKGIWTQVILAVALDIGNVKSLQYHY